VLRFELANGRHLRLLAEPDAPELHALIDANRTYLARWMPWAQKQTPAQTLDFIRSTRRQLVDNDGFQVALIEQLVNEFLDEAQIVGVIGFLSVDWTNRAASIGYWLAEAAQGQGTMTQAVCSLLDHALGAWQLNRVEIRADVENRRSRAIPERLGFQQEGTLRQAARIGDRYVDHALYAMLAEDWPPRAAGPTAQLTSR
jgi:ribosomal-protein-serine acetyltransferase